jgi:hypothetical protein
MRTCFIIKVANKDEVDIEAVLGVDSAKIRHRRTGGILVLNKGRFLTMHMDAIQQIHDSVSKKYGLASVKFTDKKVAIEKTIALLFKTVGSLPSLGEKIRHVIPKPKRKFYVRRKTGINLPPKDFIKNPRAGTSREKVLRLLLRDQGASLDDLVECTNSNANNVRVILHDISRRCGYGVRTENPGALCRYYAYLGAYDPPEVKHQGSKFKPKALIKLERNR